MSAGYTDEFVGALVRDIGALIRDLDTKASAGESYSEAEQRAYRYAATELYRIMLDRPGGDG